MQFWWDRAYEASFMFFRISIVVHYSGVEPGGAHVSFGLPKMTGFPVKANVYPLQDICDKLLVGVCRQVAGPCITFEWYRYVSWQAKSAAYWVAIFQW